MKITFTEKSEKSDKCGNSLSGNGRWDGFFEKSVKIVSKEQFQSACARPPNPETPERFTVLRRVRER
jgi:hypothetical protein